MNSNIELKDTDYQIVRTEKPARKIKLKPVSFTMISNAWKKFKLGRLEKQLEKAKESLISMKPAKTLSHTITKKAFNVARLEAKIDILNHPNSKTNYKKVENRAIKIKNNVMANIQYSANNRYEIPEDKVNDVFDTKPKKSNDTQNIKQEVESKSINNTENKDNNATSVEQNNKEQSIEKSPNEVITTPNQNDIKATINKIFEEQEKREINKENVSDIIGNSMENIKQNQDVSTTDVNSTIDEQISRTKVSKNKSTAAKISHINPDGTYHLTKEQIIDGKTYIDPSKIHYKVPVINTEENVSANVQGLNDDIFGTNPNNSLNNNKTEEMTKQETVRDIPVVVPERTSSDNKFKFVDESTEKEKPQNNIESVEKVSPEQSLHFDYSNASVQDLTKAVDNAQSMDDINALRDRVAKLKREKEESEREVREATNSAEQTEKRYQETIQQFATYAQTLEESCKSNKQNAAEQLAKQQQREAAIQEMLEAMGSSNVNMSNTTKKGK